MSGENEAVVRRFYEEMNNDRKNDLAADLFTADHKMHDPQVTAADGPDGMVAVVSTYQTAVNGHWEINDLFSSGDKVVVRWTGTGEHVAELNGIAPTGKAINVERDLHPPDAGRQDRRDLGGLGHARLLAANRRGPADGLTALPDRRARGHHRHGAHLGRHPGHAVLAIAGGLLTWGSNFADDYVHDELAAQNITFPDAEALAGQGRDDLVKYAGQQVDTGKEAEAYASYIGGHVVAIADGKTYAELGGPERAAEAAVNDAIANGAPADEVAALEDAAATISGQRESIFRGEVLRGALLNTFAWATIGQIAGIAAIAAFVAAGAMLVLVLAGVFHLRRARA